MPGTAKLKLKTRGVLYPAHSGWMYDVGWHRRNGARRNDRQHGFFAELLSAVKTKPHEFPIVSLDPGDILSTEGLHSQVVQSLLKCVDYLLLKYDELLTLVGYNGYRNEEVDRDRAVQRIMKESPNLESVIVERGLDRYFIHMNGHEHAEPTWLPLQRGYKENDIVDDTGAGDVFDAAFIYGKLTARSPKQIAWLVADVVRIHLRHLGTCGYEAFKWAAPTVFLSHSSADKFLVENIADALNDANIGVWLDAREMGPGDDLATHIKQGIRECDTVVVCASPEAMRSDWVQRELEWAQAEQHRHGLKTKVVIAIVRKLDDSARKKLGDFLFIDLTENAKHGILRLVRTIREQLENAESNCRCKLLSEVRHTRPR